MDCATYLGAVWNVGRDLQFPRRTYTSVSKKLTKLLLTVNLANCNIEGWDVIAYFKKPGFKYKTSTDTDPDKALVVPGIIKDGNVVFDLEGDILGAFGVWSIEFALKGPNGENVTTGESITYTVAEDIEGTETPVQPSQGTVNTIGDLVKSLTDATAEGKLTIIAAGEAEKSLVAQIVIANEKNDTLNATIVSGNETNDDILESIETANTVIETIATDSENAILLTEQLMTNLNEDYVTASTNIDAKTTRSIELIKQATNVALEAIRKMKEGL
jgi:hypothetical protein